MSLIYSIMQSLIVTLLYLLCITNVDITFILGGNIL